MKKKMLWYGAGLFLLLVILSSSLCAGPRKEVPAADIAARMEEIKSVNLINSLYLTPGQKAKLVEIGRNAENADVKFEAAFRDYESQSMPLLQDMKKELVKGPQLSPELTKRWHELHGKTEALLKSRIASQKDAVARALALLTDNQKILVRQYTPCIVPVKSLSNPDRVGQAAAAEAGIRILERARAVPGEKWSDAKKMLVERLRDRYENKMTDEELDALAQKLSKSLEKARSLSQEDFELQKDQLAEEFQHRQKENRRDLENKVRKFLISPEAVTMLKAQ